MRVRGGLQQCRGGEGFTSFVILISGLGDAGAKPRVYAYEFDTYRPIQLECFDFVHRNQTPCSSISKLPRPSFFNHPSLRMDMTSRMPRSLTIKSFGQKLEFHPFLFKILCLCLGLSSLPVYAEETDESEDENVFELSPFEVSGGDDGYIATNSISATGIRVPIFELPMPIEVVTSEFLDDTGASDLSESLQYSAGVYSQAFEQVGGANRSSNGFDIGSAERSPSAASNPNNPFANTYNIRGFNVPTQQRNGFRVGGSIAEWGVTLGGLVEPVNVDRIEVVRGPQSLLYGVSVISGVVNVISKAPQPYDAATIEYTYGSDNFHRVTLDVTGPTRAVDNLNFRLTGALRDSDSWIDFKNTHTEYTSFALEYKPKKRMRFLFEVQHGYSKQTGIGDQSVSDTVRSVNVQPSDDERFEPFEPVTFENRWGEPYNWARDKGNWGSSHFNDEAQEMPFGDFGPNYNISGPDTYYKRNEWNFLAEANLPLAEGLDLSLGAFYAVQDIESFEVEMQTVIGPGRYGPAGTLDNYSQGEDPDYMASVTQLFTYGDDDAQIGFVNNNNRAVAYWWTKRPQEGESMQYRAQLNYKIEIDDLWGLGYMSHRFFAGAQYTEDTFDYTTDKPNGNRLQQLWNNGDDGENNPLYFRSVFDLDPIRYSGETLAIPNLRYMHTELWFKGFYGVYEGHFWKDRVTLIVGARRDIYNGEDYQYVRPGDSTDENGVLSYETLSDGSFDYNGSNKSYGFYSEELRPQYGANFDEDVDVDTFTSALGFKLNDHLNLYVLAAGGVSPNTGLLDGAGQTIDPELTSSQEIGLKWQLLDGRLSGSVAAYRIQRKNAVWFFAGAPNPFNWETGDDPYRGNGSIAFDPRDTIEAHPNADYYAPISYKVRQDYFIGLDGFDAHGNPIGGADAVDGILDLASPYLVVDYSKIRDPNHPLHDAVEAAFVAPPESVNNSFAWTRSNATREYSNNASSSLGGANCTFEDEAIGVDFQVFYAPADNWQIILAYSHTEREATSPLQLAGTEWTDSTTGQTYQMGTEYDIWVYRLGRENFADADYSDGLDPTSHNAGGVKGLSLFFEPEDTFSVWNKYSIREGLLNGVSIGGGVLYYGPSKTSISIGGESLRENEFNTPDLPGHYTVNALLSYDFTIGGRDVSVQLNVNNVLDKTESLREVSLEDSYDFDRDGDELRRSYAYYAPRSFRLKVKMDF